MEQSADERKPVTGRTSVRVRYPETDRMGVVYHGNYIVWFEIGRTELMRELGCTYKELEERDSIFLPVIEMGASFYAPTRYDELLNIDTRLASLSAVRVRFEYQLTRPGEEKILARGFTVHAAVRRGGQPSRLPDNLRRLLEGRENCA